MSKVFRIFVEKKDSIDVKSKEIFEDIKKHLEVSSLQNLKLVNIYDIEGVDENFLKISSEMIFSEPNLDNVYFESYPISSNEKFFCVEYLPGQYDQRADSAAQCVQILTKKEKPTIKTTLLYILKGTLSSSDIEKIKKYLINTIDSREATLSKAITLSQKVNIPQTVEIIDNFINFNEKELMNFYNKNSLAMSFEDVKYCQNYFKNDEKRNPSITEIKVLDTYWSDHCRHTTFMTEIDSVEFENGKYKSLVEKSFEDYKNLREEIYDKKIVKPMCLMDMATIKMKEFKEKGILNNLDLSEEINACSIKVKAQIDNEEKDWLVMFKNETHNHPTEIEPFGGAATCLGGAIRDPLSGRSYVYQAMRVTGSGDPTVDVSKTIEGKLPQRKITTLAAHGYSSYGNQIGLATGLVREIYDENYIAKRMEVGAVVGAAPAENVVREKPQKGDVVILIGGKTGRDGCGGATGSSKIHDETSIETSNAEVQKGNAPEERKLQRFFRNSEISKKIKRCNDFGAGGVSVAIGELSEGIDIYLDNVPKKYDGLDGTELAISESQERMAVVIDKKDIEFFIKAAEDENLEAVKVADITDENRLRMYWNNNIIVNIDRNFLDTAGVRQKTSVKVKNIDDNINPFLKTNTENSFACTIKNTLSDLNVCSQKGMGEMFDSTIGSGTVLSPFGGKYQMTPAESMVSKLPVINGETDAATIMSYGYNPLISKWSPFHGAYFAVLESISKIVSSGGDYKEIRMSFQEYFERLEKNPEKWGKPFSALLGAIKIQDEYKICAIGGKDSMSGSYKDELHVPPTLVSFALAPVNVEKVISNDLKKTDSKLILLYSEMNEDFIPDSNVIKKNYEKIIELNDKKLIRAANPVTFGGVLASLSKMSFGNKIGIEFNNELSLNDLTKYFYGGIILEVSEDFDYLKELKDNKFIYLGKTSKEENLCFNNEKISIDEALKYWSEKLEDVFHSKLENSYEKIESSYYEVKTKVFSTIKKAKPKVFIPVFYGTNCEYDSKKAFEKAGAEVIMKIFRNFRSDLINESINEFKKSIEESQIMFLPGGFSAGDEPDGSGKFIATIFRNEALKNSVMELLEKRDGLILGICNGFQALIKLGLLPYGKIRNLDINSPTLTYNKIGKHFSGVIQTKIISNKSPWLYDTKCGDVHTIPVSHGEGRFLCDEKTYLELLKNGQIATQYVDLSGNLTYEYPYNPNGSYMAVEGITSFDGRIFGKMGHSERISKNTLINIYGEKDQKIFESGVNYFRI